MPETQDVLYMVLAFCALWFTMFLCWVMYQAASLLRRVHGLVDEVREKVNELVDGVSAMRMKFEGNLNVLSSVADGVRRIMDALKSRDRM